jgi:RsiW-degrading membrane proteinase PrsW (M82 family)
MPAQTPLQTSQITGTPTRKTNGMAITALILGISSFIFVITSIPAIIFGVIALNQIKKDPSQEGKGMAVAGLVCGSIVTFLAVLAIIFFVLVAVASSTTTSDFWVSAVNFFSLI